MTNRLFTGQERIRVRALFLGQRFDLRTFEHAQCLAEVPTVVTAGASGCAVLFRYGVAVVYGLNAVEEVSLIEDLNSFIIEPISEVETEEIDLVIDRNELEGVGSRGIRLHEASIERLQLVGGILAKSVVLAHYEKNIADSFDRIEPLASDLQQFGRGGRKGRELLRQIGRTLSIQAKMVGRVEIEEKPELLWENPELERLYLRLEDEYELRERHLALERKLELISRTAETVLGLLQDRRTLHVEWYIVFLIMFEILLTLYELFVAPLLGH